MNTKLTITGLLLVILLSCNQRSENKRTQTILRQDSIKLVKIEKEKNEKNRRDSLILIEQNKVIGNVLFGMSKEEVEIRIAKFQKESQRPDKVLGKPYYDYFIGEYEYLQILDFYNENKLYKLLIQGNVINWEYFDIEVPKQIQNITNVISQKYGEPDIHYELKPRYQLEEGYYYTVNRWTIGKKTIEISVEAGRTSYQVNVTILLPEVEEKLKNAAKQREKASTESAKNVF